MKNVINKNCNNFKHLGPRESLLEFYKCYSYSVNPEAEWRPIPGFPNYSISSCGLVLNNCSYGGKSRIVVPTLRHNTYFYVTIRSENGKRVGVPIDRLVALTFFDEGIKKHARIEHIDNIKFNNRIENLRIKN